MDRYSRTIAFLKVLLPLTALAILATLFLLSQGQDQVAKLPFSDTDVFARTRDQQVTRPVYSGVTSSGDEITVTAVTARPGNETTPGDADELNAQLNLANGQIITLESDHGSFSPVSDYATFIGNVRINTSNGFLVLTDELQAALHGVEGNTPGRVHGTGPIGDITAGNMEFSAKSGNGDLHMLFKNGVKLIYDPKQSER